MKSAWPELLTSGCIVAAVLGTRLWQCIFAPELTEMQAFRVYWPAWAMAGALMFAYIGLRLRPR